MAYGHNAICYEPKFKWSFSYSKTILFHYLETAKILFFGGFFLPALMAQLDARPTGDQEVGVRPLQGWQHSFMEIDHKIFFSVIFSLLLIQEGSCQFLEKECAQYWLTT